MKTESYYIALSFSQVLDLAKQLPAAEKQRLITVLQKSLKPSESHPAEPDGKYQDHPQPPAAFDSPADIFKEYME